MALEETASFSNNRMGHTTSTMEKTSIIRKRSEQMTMNDKRKRHYGASLSVFLFLVLSSSTRAQSNSISIESDEMITPTEISPDDMEQVNLLRSRSILSSTSRNLFPGFTDRIDEIQDEKDQINVGVKDCPWRGFNAYTSECLGYLPWLDTIGGNCITDVGYGTRSCVVQSKKYICDYLRLVDPECFTSCWEFHNQCCCNPLYPTVEPTSTPSFLPTESPFPTFSPTTDEPTVFPTITPTFTPTLSLPPTGEPTTSSIPSIVPSSLPSNIFSTVPSSLPSLAPTVAPSGVPSVSKVPTIKPVPLSCPWKDFGGSFDSCLQNLDGILKELCFFDSADSNRGIKGCPKVSRRTCDVSDFYQMTRGCKSKCQSFHTTCCCAIKDRGYTIPMPTPVFKWVEIEGNNTAVFPDDKDEKESNSIVGEGVVTIEGSANTDEDADVNSDSFGQTLKISVNDRNANNFGKSVAIALNALTVAVGAPGGETGGIDTGLVEVFNRRTVQDDFELFQVLMPQADGADAEDSNFGSNIEMKSGFFIVISAPNFDTRNNGDRGKLYFYERTSLNLAFLPSNTYNGGCAGQLLGGDGIAIEGNNTSLQVHTMSENAAKDCIKNENNVRTWNLECSCPQYVWWNPIEYVCDAYAAYPNIQCVEYRLSNSPTIAPTTA